jgi:hypothetical protein
MRAEEFVSKPHLYLDMDGVQADFFTAWAKLFGKERYKDIGDRAAREASINDLNQRGPEFIRKFFATLPVLPGAAELIAFLRDNRIPYTVLSAPLRGNEEASIEGKRIWLDRHHPGTSQNAIFTSEKQRYATTGGQPNVLVDDFKKYINAWQADGGIAVLYRWNNVSSAIEQLKKIYGIDQQDIEENFADGKVSGKSRPGRVKRSGASCKGSVTDLRARAKKYGGERGKMYHWCANMKSGKKKK